MMAISELELSAVLGYCRALLDAADQLDTAGRQRSAVVTGALRAWNGPHGQVFAARASDESSDLRSVIAGLRDEADAWARVWADTVNAVNRDRRQARVGEISAARGVGERLVDIVAGDDSTEHLRHYLPVLVPTAATRYAPTGGLERF